MRLASVVFAPILDGIPFEALQLFRCVKRGLLLFSCQSLNELYETLHVVNVAGEILRKPTLAFL